jgi:hypothetical protein
MNPFIHVRRKILNYYIINIAKLHIICIKFKIFQLLGSVFCCKTVVYYNIILLYIIYYMYNLMLDLKNLIFVKTLQIKIIQLFLLRFYYLPGNTIKTRVYSY